MIGLFYFLVLFVVFYGEFFIYVFSVKRKNKQTFFMFFLLFRLLCVISVMLFPFSSKLPGSEKSEALGGHEKIPLFPEGLIRA